MNKKGQAATLIFLILIVLVFYILFLPESERQKILNETDSENFSNIVNNIEKINLLSSDIGSLSYVKENYIEHSLTPALLDVRANAVVLSEINPFIIRNGWIFSKDKNVGFIVESPELVNNVFLSFQLVKSLGILNIKLNDVSIFEGVLDNDKPALIQLKKNLLQKINTLDFEVAGFGFFAREYQFKDVKIVGDVLDFSRRFVFQTFIVSPEEKANIDSGALSFYAVCSRETVGILNILLNNKVLFAGAPNCNSINRFETLGSDFNEGRNKLSFELPNGKARLDSVVIKTKLKPTKSFIDYFNVNSTVYSKINSKRLKIWLRMDFVDDSKQKIVDVNVNGVLSTVDQSGLKYEKDITSRIRAGNNYLALTPKTELNVVNLKINAE